LTLASEVCENIDRRFGALIAGSGTVELLFNKCRWAEGPVWFADTNQLVWSDIPNSRMLR
jgi:gluconolactonase